MANTTDNATVPQTSTFIGEEINENARVFFVVMGSVMVLTGVIGNWLLIAVISKHFLRRRCVHNLFIANLALADILTLGYWFTFFVLDLILGFHPVVDQAHCVANGVLVAVLCLVTVTSLLSISLNRYLHVCHSHLYARLFTFRRTVVCCLLSWLTGLVLALPPVFLEGPAGAYHYNHRAHFCSFDRRGLTYPKVMVVLFSTLPMLVIAYCNFAIFRFWRRARMSLTTRYPTLTTQRSKKRRLLARWKASFRGKTSSLPSVTVTALTADAAGGRGARDSSCDEGDCEGLSGGVGDKGNCEGLSRGVGDDQGDCEGLSGRVEEGFEVHRGDDNDGDFCEEKPSAKLGEEDFSTVSEVEESSAVFLTGEDHSVVSGSKAEDSATESSKDEEYSTVSEAGQSSPQFLERDKVPAASNAKTEKSSTVMSGGKEDFAVTRAEERISKAGKNSLASSAPKATQQKGLLKVPDQQNDKNDHRSALSSPETEGKPATTINKRDDENELESASNLNTPPKPSQRIQADGHSNGDSKSNLKTAQKGQQASESTVTFSASHSTPGSFNSTENNRDGKASCKEDRSQGSTAGRSEETSGRGEMTAPRGNDTLGDSFKDGSLLNRVFRRKPVRNASQRTLEKWRLDSPSPTHTLASASSTSTYKQRPTLSRPSFRHLSKRHPKPATQTLQKRAKKNKAKEIAFVRSLFVVFILNFLLFVPYGIIIVTDSYVKMSSEVVIFGNILLFLNNAVNWIVYGAMNPTFRRGYVKYARRVLAACCCVGKKRAGSQLNASLSSLMTVSSQRLNTDAELEQSFTSLGLSGAPE